MSQSEETGGFSEFLRRLQGQKLPPVERWTPTEVRDMDLEIDASGEWYYQGTVFQRKDLVRLLSTVLIREGDEFFLVSPAEKLRISVKDAPFVAIDFERSLGDSGPTYIFDTNVDFKVPLDRKHPMLVRPNGVDGQTPYLRVRDGLEAKLTRSVYYRLVQYGVERTVDGERQFGIDSAGDFFLLGPVTW